MSYDPNQTFSKLISYRAQSGGHEGRSIRLDGGKYPLATCTYNYSQTDDTKAQVAERIASLWNFAAGTNLSELETLIAAGMTLGKLVTLLLEKHEQKTKATTPTN
ncbi:hypothetical protein ABH908_000083 [Pseudomonas frederiksbergensis]|uniref:hypothetical protein n=1 Tax=Pseudomonas TaxID=286 RepID=UPI003D1A793F